MRKRSRKKDVNEIAASIVDKITRKDISAFMSAMGRKGGLKGGAARSAKLTKEQKSASASKAARARWDKEREV